MPLAPQLKTLRPAHKAHPEAMRQASLRCAGPLQRDAAQKIGRRGDGPRAPRQLCLAPDYMTAGLVQPLSPRLTVGPEPSGHAGGPAIALHVQQWRKLTINPPQDSLLCTQVVNFYLKVSPA